MTCFSIALLRSIDSLTLHVLALPPVVLGDHGDRELLLAEHRHLRHLRGHTCVDATGADGADGVGAGEEKHGVVEDAVQTKSQVPTLEQEVSAYNNNITALVMLDNACASMNLSYSSI